MSVILNRRESATVLAGLRLLAGDGVRVPNYPYALVAGLYDETDPEYELRFDVDEEYLRELIDRIDGMSLRGVKLCNRCTEKHPGKRWRLMAFARMSIPSWIGHSCCCLLQETARIQVAKHFGV